MSIHPALRHRSMRHAVAVSCAALVGALLVASPAHADRYTKGDRAGDMVRVNRVNEGFAAPGHRNFDLRSVTVRHTKHFVSIRGVAWSLRRLDLETFYLGGFIKTNQRKGAPESEWSWDVEFNNDKRPREGSRLFIMDAEHGESYGCDGYGDRGFRARANFDRDRVTVIIPRRCLDSHGWGSQPRPRWVRVSVGVLTGPARGAWYYIDDLGSRSRPMGYYIWNSYLTPRIYAG